MTSEILSGHGAVRSAKRAVSCVSAALMSQKPRTLADEGKKKTFFWTAVCADLPLYCESTDHDGVFFDSVLDEMDPRGARSEDSSPSADSRAIPLADDDGDPDHSPPINEFWMQDHSYIESLFEEFAPICDAIPPASPPCPSYPDETATGLTDNEFNTMLYDFFSSTVSPAGATMEGDEKPPQPPHQPVQEKQEQWSTSPRKKIIKLAHSINTADSDDSSDSADSADSADFADSTELADSVAPTDSNCFAGNTVSAEDFLVADLRDTAESKKSEDLIVEVIDLTDDPDDPDDPEDPEDPEDREGPADSKEAHLSRDECDVACYVCESKDPVVPSRMLFCQGRRDNLCDEGFCERKICRGAHLSCVRLHSVPLGDWLCLWCERKTKNERETRRLKRHRF